MDSILPRWRNTALLGSFPQISFWKTIPTRSCYGFQELITTTGRNPWETGVLWDAWLQGERWHPALASPSISITLGQSLSKPLCRELAVRAQATRGGQKCCWVSNWKTVQEAGCSQAFNTTFAIFLVGNQPVYSFSTSAITNLAVISVCQCLGTAWLIQVLCLVSLGWN